MTFWRKIIATLAILLVISPPLVFASGYSAQSYEKLSTDATYFDNDHLSLVNWFLEWDDTARPLSDYFIKVGATYYAFSSNTYCNPHTTEYTPFDWDNPFPDSDFTSIACWLWATWVTPVKTSADNDSLYINHPAESCIDGIQNGDETWIDTGGDECEEEVIEEDSGTAALSVFSDVSLASLDASGEIRDGSVGSLMYLWLWVAVLTAIIGVLYLFYRWLKVKE